MGALLSWGGGQRMGLGSLLMGWSRVELTGALLPFVLLPLLLVDVVVWNIVLLLCFIQFSVVNTCGYHCTVFL